MNKKKYNENGDSLDAEVLEASDEIKEESVSREDLPEEMVIIGVRFREAGKIYYFDPVGVECSVGDSVIVKTARGSEIGRVVIPNKTVRHT